MVQRLRDPVHDLIEFEDTGLDTIAWRLIASKPFQRLRRIRQLGFSEFVFPGATHTRFSHSIGVFHNARILCSVIKNKLGTSFCQESADVAVLAALIHDLGHGPFSHAFEGALDTVGKHEEYTAEFIDHPEIYKILSSYDKTFPDKIKLYFTGDRVLSIYSSIVSSQFDADRLDYMKRDRMMTGTQLGAIDFTWLIRNLEVSKIPVGVDAEKIADVDTLVLGEKALWAGEGYVLSLFHLYPAVYLHKTTRGAEKVFSLLLRLTKDLVHDKRGHETGLPDNHPLLVYLRNPKLDTYADLDDAVIWGALPMMMKAKDSLVARTASDLQYRNLWEAIDLNCLRRNGDSPDEPSPAEVRFKQLSQQHVQSSQDWTVRVLGDSYTRNPYKRQEYGSSKSLEKIHILSEGRATDLAQVSAVVGALKKFKVNRLYIRRDDNDARELIHGWIREAKDA